VLRNNNYGHGNDNSHDRGHGDKYGNVSCGNKHGSQVGRLDGVAAAIMRGTRDYVPISTV
jgi:hypothetical protein